MWRDWRNFKFNTLEGAVEHEKKIIESEEVSLADIIITYGEIGKYDFLDFIRNNGLWEKFKKDFECEIEQAKKYYLDAYAEDCWEEEP